MAVDVQELARLQRENASLRHGVPAELLADIPAEKVDTHAAALAQAFARQRQTPAPTGAPVPASNEATLAPTAEEQEIRQWQRNARWRGGRFGPRTMMDPAEADEARQAFFRISWNRHMEHRRRGHGDVGPPPAFTAPGAGPPAIPPPGRAI